MSAVFTGTLQGRFTSDGTAKFISLRSDVDWMWVYNETILNDAALAVSRGAQFYWQRGMAQGRGIEYVKLGAVANDPLTTVQIPANSGFYLFDNTINVPGPAIAISNINNGTPPVVTTASSASLNTGDIVRIFRTPGALQLGGLDFTVGDIADATHFELAYMSQIADSGNVIGSWRKIPYDSYFYPRQRVISAITQAQQAVVTMTVTHTFKVGDVVRFVVPQVTAAAFGMTELDGVQATVVAVDHSAGNNSITVDVDTTGFTAFAFPLTANGVFTPAQVVPVGANTAEALRNGVLTWPDATLNEGKIGMKLMAGDDSPAGAAGDVIYWVAGKSYSVNNQ